MKSKSIYILKAYSINYILRKNTILKAFPLDKINGTKNAFFFFREHQLVTVLLLICVFYMSWNIRFVSIQNLVWGFQFLIPFLFYWSLYFTSAKCMDSLTLKGHNSFQNQNNRNPDTALLLDLSFLSCHKKF